jgi:hypothetical protein
MDENLLRAIDVQMSGTLVELILDHVGRHDLDVRTYDAGRISPGRDTMPRMSLEQKVKELVKIRILVWHEFGSLPDW